MANKRVFYACQRAGIAPVGSLNFATIRGLQTLGITTTFNLEQVFEIGQLAIYDNIEGIPDVEVSTEKVMDGYAPVYLLATQANDAGSAPSSSSLVGRSQGQCMMAVSIYDETNDYAEGTVGAEVHMSGLYPSSISYSATVDGNCTESVTLVGNNKVWVIGGDTGNFVGYSTTPATWVDTPWSGGDTSPQAAGGYGGVNRREDVIFGSGSAVSLIPVDIPGIVDAGGGSGLNMLTGEDYGAHIQSITISTDLGREELFELGRRGTYYRYINFPVEVTSEIGVIATSGDMVSATEDGLYEYEGMTGTCGTRYNLLDYRVRLVLCEGLIVDCGDKNKLSSVGVTGGDAGGGNMEVTYSYTNFNTFDVKHPSDPVVTLRPWAYA